VVLALLAFWLLTASAVRIKYRAVRYPVLLVAVIVGALVSFGTTIAYFESAFPPERTEIMATDLTCEITGWGSAGSSSGYTVHLYKLWPGVRLIKKEVVTFSVVQAGFVGDPPADRTCADALETYRRSS
jgi:hypothetical protein